MKVILLSHTPDPEKVVACSAKLCYSSSDITTLNDNLTDEKVQSFVQMLASIGHESPIEHISFTFGIEGISRACSHQLVRHRIASYSQKSQRYVSEQGFDHVVPPEIQNTPEALAEFENQMQAISDSYNKITEILTDKHYKQMLSEGMDEKTAKRNAQKKAIEDARFVLPNACTTQIIVTMNARTLLNFFEHRCCNRAQWEIRAVANEMLRLVSQVAPNIFAKAGPPCLYSSCPEGKMSCRKSTEVKKYFEELKNEWKNSSN